MQLTRYTDYGLRVLIYLALLPKDERASIDQISQVYGISRNNVNKIVHQLGKTGVITTKRGKGGGFQLNLAPDKINIGEMVVLMENSLELVDCESPRCSILPACRLKGVFIEAQQAFLTSLKQYSLADLVETQRDSLVTILEIR